MLLQNLLHTHAVFLFTTGYENMSIKDGYENGRFRLEKSEVKLHLKGLENYNGKSTINFYSKIVECDRLITIIHS